MNRFAIITLILLSVAFVGRAQSPVEILSKKFDAYNSIRPNVKLHLVFNQNKFTPGDTAWFKAYFLTEDLKGVTGKQLIDLNLVDSRGVSLLHQVFSVIDGIGQNQLAIPDTLSQGIYLLTAHSSWMKNFDPPRVFKKEISIVRKNKMVTDDDNTLSAVVEGKHLIAGVSNRIAIQTSPETNVQIIDAAGQEINHAMTNQSGIGSIVFKPLSKTSYFVRKVGSSIQIPLSITEDGCSLQFLLEEGAESTKLTLTMPTGSLYRNEELVVLMSARGKVYQGTTFVQSGKEDAFIQLPLRDLPEGVAHVSVLTRNGILLASRDFYRSIPSQVSVKISTAKPVFERRDKASVEVSIVDGSGQPLKGEFSISVVNSNLLEQGKQNSLPDELNILSGTIGDFLIDRTDTNWLASLDHFLILSTQDMPWEQIMQNNVPEPRFPFTNVIEKSGHAYLADTGQPVPDMTQILFYLQKDKMHYQTLAREKGKVALAIGDLYGEDEFFYLGQANGNEVTNIKVKWDDDAMGLPRAPIAHETQVEDSYAFFIQKKKLIDQSFGFYKVDGLTNESNDSHENNDFEQEVMEADITVDLGDYILFPTMAELLKEIVPSAYYRENHKVGIVRVQVQEPMTANSDPLYIIDEIATKNTAFFLSLKPAELLSIKIINTPKKLYPLGLLGKNGIIIVHTKKGDAREPLVDQSRVLKGINKPAIFKTIKHLDGEDLRKPDFRSTMYWNPSIKTDSNGKATIEFFCSDDVGKMDIRIDGLTASGKPFTTIQSIEMGAHPK